MREFICLLGLCEEDLSQGNLKNEQRYLWSLTECNFNGTLIIVRSNFGKAFAFYISEKF